MLSLGAMKAAHDHLSTLDRKLMFEGLVSPGGDAAELISMSSNTLQSMESSARWLECGLSSSLDLSMCEHVDNGW
jgi:hypothetical protein